MSPIGPRPAHTASGREVSDGYGTVAPIVVRVVLVLDVVALVAIVLMVARFAG